MKTRVMTAVVGVPLLIFALIVRGWFAELLLATLTVIALGEMYKALTEAGYRVCPWGGYIGAGAMWVLNSVMGVLDPLLVLSAAVGITMFGVLRREKPAFPDAAASVYPLLTCLMPFAMFMMMLNRTFGTVPGIALITMSFGIAYGCDVMAYLGGRTFGKRKLCPAVSPNKTVEGAISGTIGGVIVALLVRAFFVNVTHTPMPGIPATLILGFVGAIAGQVGDLTASLLKRHSGIKDYGKLFPGHGGVMDRFDSVIFTLIVLYCYTLVLY